MGDINQNNFNAFQIQQQPYSKMVIKDDFDTNLRSQNPKPYASSNAPQYPAQYPAQYNIQYQQPNYQQYPAQYHQQQQFLNAPECQNSADPQAELLYLDARGFNIGKNRQYGLFITFMWMLELLAKYFFIEYAKFQEDQDFYQISMFCLIVNAIILFSCLRVQLADTKTQAALLMAFVITDIYSEIYVLETIYRLFGIEFLSYVVIFYFSLFIVLAVSFFYLLILKKKPSMIVLPILTTIAVILVTTLYLQYYGFIEFEYYIVPVFFSVIQSCFLVLGLQKVYRGKHTIINKDRIILGFIQLQVYYFLPCL